MSDPALAFRQLSYAYPDGTAALRSVSFALAPGERVGLVGPNGAGKSTLLLHAVGLLPARGAVLVGGLDPDRVPREVRQQVGLLFQNPDDQLFLPTVAEDVAFGPLNLGLSAADVEQRVATALAQVGLTGLGAKLPQHLSLGQRRRAALATVLAMGCQTLVLDEPTANLDPGGRRQLLALLTQLPGALLLATHDLEAVLQLCPRVVVLRAGEVVADGETAALLADPELMQRCELEVPWPLRR
ncbi:MAG: energy-coupling factor ABC transporter ATP-binding protein [Fimbriimonadaceae bacterium]|nr:energy-coupling factor ABC transporter ATP-binding protein [Fimbriimonadaceae bacterium]